MGKLRFTFSNIFLLVGFLCCALLLENLPLLMNPGPLGITDPYFYTIFAVCIVSYGAMFFLEHRENKTKVDCVLLPFLALLFVGGVIAIWTYKDITFTNAGAGMSFTASLSDNERIRFTLSLFAFCLTVYSLTFIYSKNVVTSRRMRWLHYIILLTCVFCIIYSAITEYAAYEQRTLVLAEGVKLLNIKSLFWNANAFGSCVLMGLASLTILNYYKRSVIWYILMLGFYFELLMIASVLSIICGTFLIVAFLFLDIATIFKHRSALGMFCLGIYILILVTLAILFRFSQITDMGTFSHLSKNIWHEITKTDFASFSHRLVIWENSFAILGENPMRYIFGLGHGVSNKVINAWAMANAGSESITLTSAHNGFIQMILNYGIVGSLFYVLIIGYFFVSCFKLFKKDLRFVFTFLVVGITFLGYSVGESIFFFNSNLQGLVIGTFYFLPVIMRAQLDKKKAYLEDVKSIKEDKERMPIHMASEVIRTIFVSLALAGTMLLIFNEFMAMEFYVPMVESVIIGLILIAIFGPIINHYLTNNEDKVKAYMMTGVNWAILVMACTMSILMVLRFMGYTSDIVWISALIIGGALLIDSIVVFIIRGRKAKLYKPQIFYDVTTLFLAAFFTALIVGLTMLFMQGEFANSQLIYIVVPVATLVVFYFLIAIIPSKEVKATWKYLDWGNLIRVKHSLLKQERSEQLWKSE